MAMAYFLGGIHNYKIVEFDGKINFPIDGYSIYSKTVELNHSGIFQSYDSIYFVANEIKFDEDKIHEYIIKLGSKLTNCNN